jgi:hypothetical protein
MSLILAVEPDRRQAAHLTHIVRQRVGVELVLAETTELALAQIGNRVPDLILVPALLSPTDDAALAAALRVIASAAHVQMVTTPLFASAAPERKMRGVLAAFRRSKPTKPATDGCDPAEFAQQISSYLESAAEARSTAQYVDPPVPVRAASPSPIADTPQRYVPLEPGRLYREETAASSQAFLSSAIEPVPELAMESPEAAPVVEPAAAVEPGQETAYERPYVERIYQPVESLPEPALESPDPLSETSEPLFAASEPRIEIPEPLHETPELLHEALEPLHETPELLLETSEPVLETPEPVLEASEPAFETSEPAFETSEPVFETPEPVFETSEPVFETSEPVFQTSEPVFETPEPVFETPEPVFETPEPVFETPEPVLDVPEPVVETTEPTFETPEPLAARGPGYARRIGFVVDDEQPEFEPIAAESLEIDGDPIEISASSDTPFTIEAITDEEPAFSASSTEDEAIELVDIDLSSDFSEFDDLHVVEAQSQDDVVETPEAPEVVEAASFAPPPRVIEVDSLKEFAAAVEALTASEQTAAIADAAAEARAFEFDDLFPPRQPVEPSPLGAWRSWIPLEGTTAEAWEAPVPAHVVERAVERAPERPDWVELIESLRVDVERRRSEQSSGAPKPARKAPPAPTRPVQDEWGLFDPAQCGFAALLAKLDEITEANQSRPHPPA